MWTKGIGQTWTNNHKIFQTPSSHWTIGMSLQDPGWSEDAAGYQPAPTFTCTVQTQSAAVFSIILIR